MPHSLLLLAFATLVSEDLACIAAGALIASGKLGFVPGVLACSLGIYAGDLLLYFAGRFVGRPIMRWRPFRRILSDSKIDRASQWLSDRGARVVLVSRFTPGLRLPTYFAAGLLKTRFWTFNLYFLAAAAVWTPILVGAVALLGETAIVYAPLLAILLILGRARKQAVPWEFWPPWLTYLPLIPYLLYLSLKHRSPTLFTAANPGIPSGGFVGESKSAILSHLTHVPEFTVIRASLPFEQRIESAQTFIAVHDLHYPVVLKPDVGERGNGVAIARSGNEVRSYLQSATADTIIQKYVDGPECGIFYYRYPGEADGRIFSITEKRFPHVTGDGKSTLAELIRQNERAVRLAAVYLSRSRRAASDVPATGEVVPLVEIGSHCKGAVFLNGAHLETEALLNAIDSVAKSHPGFYFGRFDLRAGSIQDLQAGQFSVIELNGVSAEATHIYDPAVSIIEAYRVMFRQWRIAFEIGGINRKAGVRPMPLREFLHLVRTRGAYSRAHSENRQIPSACRTAA